jgi:hypothetical protein
LLVLYGFETWSVAVREEHRVRVFENRARTKEFGPERQEAAGGCMKLINEERHDLYSSPNSVWEDEMGNL